MKPVWFGMDANIHTNQKVLKLADLTKLDVDTVVGKLARLFGWATQCNNETGDITHLPTQELADIMRWKKRATVLLDALLESGILERTEGRLLIHDWPEHNGSFLEKKRKDRERKSGGNS